jgi:hypothetical protein
MGEARNAYRFWPKNLKGRDHSKDLGVNGNIKLEWILENRIGICGLDVSGPDRD